MRFSAVAAVPVVISAGYQAFALLAAFRRLREPGPASSFQPPVSILKPVHGSDERFAQAIASHAEQDYPEFEILFGTSHPADAACAEVEALKRRYPDVAIRLIVVSTDAPNRKVGVMERLAADARYPLLLVNDGDIVVGPEYLREVVAPLAHDGVGVVTCLYRGAGGSFATRSEALGIATEFVPSVLVARQVGVNEFAMGSTLAFRAADLERIGGFASIREYLADDYQLGKRLTGLGKQVVLAQPVVETWLGAGTWKSVWKHQLRWSRTIRVSRTSGYFGYVITLTAWWAIVAALSGYWPLGLACYAVRWLAGVLITGLVLRDRASLALWWWMPARDLFGFAVWLAGLVGKDVEWRGKRLEIDPGGKIT